MSYSTSPSPDIDELECWSQIARKQLCHTVSVLLERKRKSWEKEKKRRRINSTFLPTSKVLLGEEGNRKEALSEEINTDQPSSFANLLEIRRLDDRGRGEDEAGSLLSKRGLLGLEVAEANGGTGG